METADKGFEGFTIGLIVGILIVTVLWIASNETTERIKVEKGYLTYDGSTYSVTLYDTLEKPERKNELSN